MVTIGQLGTFDIENYGDLLYPLVFERIIKARAARLSVHQYSFLSRSAPQKAGFVTRPVQSLFAQKGKRPSTIVIGGGDILRTDWTVVAEHYSKFHHGHYGRLRSFGAAGLARYLLRKHLHLPNKSALYASNFRSRWMNYSAIGPFLISAANLAKGSRVSYLSCGIPHEFARAEQGAVKRIFDEAQFIYLRDEQSAEKLRRAGVGREIHVAPDLIVTLSDHFDRATAARRGREILSTYGVNGDRSVLCFQSMPGRRLDEVEIVEELNRYVQRTQGQVVLLPLGFCHGDHEFLKRLSKASSGTFKYVDVYSIFDVIAVIAACDLFVGTSMHGNITAFSYGIPHLMGPLSYDKFEGFLRVANLPPELKLSSWRELNSKIDMIEELGPTFFSGRAKSAKLSANHAVDELLRCLLN